MFLRLNKNKTNVNRWNRKTRRNRRSTFDYLTFETGTKLKQSVVQDNSNNQGLFLSHDEIQNENTNNNNHEKRK